MTTSTTLWECTVCKLRNSDQRSQCLACFAKKPSNPLIPGSWQDEMGWKRCQSAPKQNLSTPLRLNETEFIVATTKTSHSEHDENEGFWIYNIVTNKWRKICSWPINRSVSYTESVLDLSVWLDRDNQMLYVHGKGYKYWQRIKNEQTKMYAVDIRLKQCNPIYPVTSKHFPVLPSIKLDDAGCHIIGGRDAKHTIFIKDNEETLFEKEIEHEVFEFDDYEEKCIKPLLIELESNYDMYLLPGDDGIYDQQAEPHKIWRYHDKKWQSTLRMPRNIYRFGAALSMNERYIVMAGGRDGSYRDNVENKIFVIDLHQNVIKQNEDIITPFKGECGAVIMPSSGQTDTMNRLLVSGCVRHWAQIFEFPLEVTDLIKKWFVGEYLHLLRNGEHWKIYMNFS